MSSQPSSRNPKRQRKKEAAAARRAALIAEMQRRRKRRTYLLASTGGAIAVGVAIVLAVTMTGREEQPAAASATPALAPSPAPIACGGSLPPAAGGEKPTFGEPEDQKLDRRKTWIWRLETSCGQIDVKLAVDKAPKTSSSIAFLTRKGFYDGLTFHRLVPDFVIQGGDPEGTGGGGPGYKVVEAAPKDTKYTKGVVAMAKAGDEAPGTSGSQFFIVHGQTTPLPADYAFAGQVTAGLETVDRIIAEAAVQGEGGAEPPPKAKVYIEKATIVEQ